MALMLNSRYSSEKFRNTVRRHIRLCKQIVNDDELITQIQPEYEALKEKRKQINAQEEIREDCYDDLILAETMMDDGIRHIFAECEQMDREKPGERCLLKVFPEQKYGNILRLPVLREMEVVENLIVRIDTLGAEHELFGLAKILREKLDQVKVGIDKLKEAEHQLKILDAEEDIAKENLAQKYELNYLDARRKYGRRSANRLFPKKSRSHPIVNSSPENESENVA